jgi:glycosyltransferase involved in cell wall biosynthesis
MDQSQGQVVALIPAYNEQDHIERVVAGAMRFLPVVVVDDGSRDRTVELAEAAGATVLRQIPNQGKGAALRRGFQYALEQGFAAVITLDADGQHDWNEIPAFVEAFQEAHAEMIIGERDFSRMPLVRRFANTTGRYLFSWALGQKVNDNQSGYRLIARQLMEKMLDSTQNGFEFEVEMIVRCVLCGYPMQGVPIRTIYADERSHIHPGTHTRNFLRLTWNTRQTVRTARKTK